MTEYSVSKNLDYLTISHDKKLEENIFGNVIEEIHSPNKNYNVAFKLETGAIWMLHTEQDRMRNHTICSGNTLGIMRGEGHSDREILSAVLRDIGVKISRIDICVTSERKDGAEHELSPHRIAEMVRDGQMLSRLKPDNHVAGPDIEVKTAYIGSRKSRNRIFRAYDKGEDLGLLPNFLHRYELETRKNAIGVARAVASGEDIGGIIRRYIDFPHCVLWKEIMGAEPVIMRHKEEYRTEEEKKSIERANRWQWLIDSAAPALAKALFEDGLPMQDNKNADIFAEAVARRFNELVDSATK